MKAFHRYSVLLGVALLMVLVWHIGPSDLFRQMASIGWGMAILLLLEGLEHMFNTLGWRQCLSGSTRTVSFVHLFRVNLAGNAINYLTPTAGLGGELTKGTLLTLNNKGAEAASGVIVGKVGIATGHLLFVVAGSILVYREVHPGVALMTALIGGSAAVGTGIVAFLLIQKYGKLGAVVRWMVRRRVGGGRMARLAGHVSRVDAAMQHFYREHPMGLPLAAVWHIVARCCGILQILLFLHLLTPDASLPTAGAIAVLGSWLDLVGFAVPADIGVFEGTRVIVFRLLGFSSNLGLTYGVTIRVLQIFWALVGLVIYATFVLKSRRKEGTMSQRLFRFLPGRWFVSLVFVAGLISLLPHGSWGQAEKEKPLVLNLEQLIEMAVAKSPEMGITASETDAARADLDQVRGAFRPQITSTGLVGPVNDAVEPVVRDGKIVDNSPSGRIGIFGRLDLTVTQPLYTFGKLENRREAAKLGVRAKELEAVQKRNEIALRIAELYYALVLARGGVQAAGEADSFFEQAHRKISRLLELHSPTVAESDLYMIEAFRSDTRRAQAEAQKGVNIAYSALKAFIGLPPGAEFETADQQLGIEEINMEDRETYAKKALSDRVEFKQLNEALNAQQYMVKAFESDRLPSLFLALEGSVAGAPGRETFDSPYIRDEFNHAYIGIVAGVRWEFDFGIQKARIAKAHAEHRKLQYTKANAEMSIPIQVTKAFEETQEWKKAAAMYRQAAVASRRWIVSALTDFDMGVGTAENMLRAMEKYSHNQGQYLEAVFNYHLSMASLKYAVGTEIASPSP